MATRGRTRRQNRRDAKKPRQQTYGGSEGRQNMLRERDRIGIQAGTERENVGLDAMDTERRQATSDLRGLSNQALGERATAGGRYTDVLGNVEGARGLSARQALTYGGGADRALQDYSAGRGAVLGGATELEQLGRGAAARYTSAADAAFGAAAERNQRSALSLAAGRGNDAIRTALATADAGNRQAQLDQQVVKAQETNQLLGLEQGAVERAAAIRSGVGAADQGAAGIQAGRQQVATGTGTQLLGLGADVTGADAQLGLATNAQRAGLATDDAQIGLGVAGARAAAGAGGQDRFLGAETAQETAQLGSNLDFERLRQQQAATKGFTGFLGKIAGGLNNVKATADAGSMGPGTKLLGKTNPV